MNGKEKGRQLVSHFLRWSGVFRSSRSLRNVQLRYAGILLEGLKDFDTFSFRKASYILEGVKPEIICQKAWIVCPQLIAKLANSHRSKASSLPSPSSSSSLTVLAPYPVSERGSHFFGVRSLGDVRSLGHSATLGAEVAL
jgi:hypothetical protein